MKHCPNDHCPNDCERCNECKDCVKHCPDCGACPNGDCDADCQCECHEDAQEKNTLTLSFGGGDKTLIEGTSMYACLKVSRTANDEEEADGSAVDFCLQFSGKATYPEDYVVSGPYRHYDNGTHSFSGSVSVTPRNCGDVIGKMPENTHAVYFKIVAVPDGIEEGAERFTAEIKDVHAEDYNWSGAANLQIKDSIDDDDDDGDDGDGESCSVY